MSTNSEMCTPPTERGTGGSVCRGFVCVGGKVVVVGVGVGLEQEEINE